MSEHDWWHLVSQPSGRIRISFELRSSAIRTGGRLYAADRFRLCLKDLVLQWSWANIWRKQSGSSRRTTGFGSHSPVTPHCHSDAGHAHPCECIPSRGGVRGERDRRRRHLELAKTDDNTVSAWTVG